MSDEVEYECSMCGREGGPVPGCGVCNGNERFRQVMIGHYLSDTSKGRGDPARYGPNGQVMPKTRDPLWTGVDETPPY